MEAFMRRHRIQTNQWYKIQWHPPRLYKLLVFRRETKMHGSGSKEWDETGNKERLQSFPENMEPYSREIQNRSFTDIEMENTNYLGWLTDSVNGILCSGKWGRGWIFVDLFYFSLGDVTYFRNEEYDDTNR
jgi:hypothetical protein